MKTIVAAAALILLPGMALANADAGPVAQADPVLENARAAFARKDWPAAQAGLRSAVASEPKNAEYHNLYAYAIRKGPNPDMSLVFKHYNQALALDPKHKGAHEYIGEAYLMVRNVAKAKEHLAQLDKLCFFGCQEYTDLKKAIAAYEKQAANR